MESISGLSSNKKVQASEEVTPKTETDNSSVGESDFASVLKSLLVPNKEDKVSEEELFAAIIKERISTLKGADAGSKYDEALKSSKDKFTTKDGFIRHEAAAVNSLQKLVKDGILTAEEGDKIYSESFAAAQLDSNTGALWDNRGGNGDPTIAVDTMAAALTAAKLTVDKFSAGELTPTALSLANPVSDKSMGGSVKSSTSAPIPSDTIAPDGTTIDGANGFLFKPVSNNQGTLAVLLHESMAHFVDSVVLKDSAGTIIDEGHSTGYGDTGEREKFSFSKKGGEYPKDITVEVRLMDGSITTYKIPDPSQRYD